MEIDIGTIDYIKPTLYNDLDKRIVKNPWLAQSKIKCLYEGNIINNLTKCSIIELSRMFKKIYIISLSKNKNGLIENLYDIDINSDAYKNIKSYIVVNQVPFSILKNTVLMNFLTIIDVEHLPAVYTDIRGIISPINENILCLSMINISEHGIDCFLKQYNGISNLSSVIQMMLINDYIQKDVYGEKNKMMRYQMINNMNESNYWTYSFNCKLNITLKFLKRGFNLSLSQRLEDKEIREIINKISNKPEEENDYLSFIFRQQSYVDASANIHKNGYQIYRINNINPDDQLSQSEFNNMLDSCITKKDLYLLLTNILVSKDLCHLVINNKHALDKLTDINLFNADKNQNEKRSLLQKYAPLFAHLWSYAWLTMYVEVSIKRSFTEQSDRFAFDLDTASKLPYFPSIPTDPESSPYLPLLVAKDILNPENNNIGVLSYCDYTDENKQPGIVSLDEFTNRMKIFISGDKNKDYFEFVNWSNIAVTGSIITAITPKFNPLMLHFMNDNEVNYNDYFHEYYRDSDIDVMCNCSQFEYIDKVYEFSDAISKAIIKYNKISDEQLFLVNVTPVKSVAVMVNKEFIEKYILPVTNITYLELLTKIHELEIKELFYPWYVKQKMYDNLKYKNTTEFVNRKYNPFFSLCKPNELLIVVLNNNGDNQTKQKLSKPNYNIKVETNDIDTNTVLIESIEEDGNIPDEDIEFENNNNTEFNDGNFSQQIYAGDCMFVCNENLKFKISSDYLNRSFEFFRIKYESFFSTVARFHLPCVRGYYNGTNGYLLPECISACMTFMNIDYKYFAGSKDPIEIINKNRMRGFGTYLNDKEKIRMIEYSNVVSKWKKLYNINIKNNSSINSFFGNLLITNKLFTPSNTLHDENINYTKNYKNDLFVSQYNIDTFYGKLFNGDFTMNKQISIQKQIYKKSCINNNGYVSQFRKWLIEACYEQPIPQIQPNK
jgi:hypothetical protein